MAPADTTGCKTPKGPAGTAEQDEPHQPEGDAPATPRGTPGCDAPTVNPKRARLSLRSPIYCPIFGSGRSVIAASAFARANTKITSFTGIFVMRWRAAA